MLGRITVPWRFLLLIREPVCVCELTWRRTLAHESQLRIWSEEDYPELAGGGAIWSQESLWAQEGVRWCVNRSNQNYAAWERLICALVAGFEDGRNREPEDTGSLQKPGKSEKQILLWSFHKQWSPADNSFVSVVVFLDEAYLTSNVTNTLILAT